MNPRNLDHALVHILKAMKAVELPLKRKKVIKRRLMRAIQKRERIR